MSVAMSLLAMVAQGPRYGYELRAEFDRRTSAQWPLNIGQVYKTLDRLEREGLVEKSASTDADGHVYYAATPAGQDASRTWLQQADPLPSAARDDLAIKLAIAVTLPGVDVAALLRAQRHAAISRLQELTRQTGGGPVLTAQDLATRIVSDAALIAAETQLRWLDQVSARVRDALARGIPLTVPFNTERPRRGRPRSTSSIPSKEPR
ncbi:MULTISPECIES: PadR family transcriptional regulator [unclassified Cryobacterium]|uniref:PadR family transcriptional regulator n=1 Tax=unclassified Cryobacterium TaxID=2649013 RepID=UPI000CE470B7|nr:MULTISPECIES: PadR family transcriptional regulator [unclassified Cryobacterium]TFD65861.1 PadR family transcriptional regulator [Cryobacterium sp. Hh38]